MLGKLLKNDIKSASKNVVYIYTVLLIALGAMGVSLVFDFGVGERLASVALVAIAGVAVLVTIIAVFLDFRKTMFGDRGYLTNTLPVSSTSLLFSKMLTSMLWIAISYVVFFAIFAGVMAYNTEKSLPADSEFSLEFILEMLPTLGIPSVDVFKVYIVAAAVRGIFQIMFFVLLVFFALTLSMIRPVQSLGLFGAILAFFVVVGLTSVLGGYLQDLFDLRILVDADAAVSFTSDIAKIDGVEAGGGLGLQMTPFILQMFLSVVLFLVTGELLEKKVNIK
ncbi:MAG: hypothetical protein LBS36_12795 [Oscillospiraceae bacterium]|jgi:hypothetical protein|nr:hypothetical protein [Oscillospiraceae bacterium]